jgi:hypothetical protein
MQYLLASWGFAVIIGGLFVVLVILMILDGPAQRQDSLRQGEQLKPDERRPVGTAESRSGSDVAPSQRASGTIGKS